MELLAYPPAILNSLPFRCPVWMGVACLPTTARRIPVDKLDFLVLLDNYQFFLSFART